MTTRFVNIVMKVESYCIPFPLTPSFSMSKSADGRDPYSFRQMVQSNYGEDPFTDREKRQAKDAVVQMLETDVFKITLMELHEN